MHLLALIRLWWWLMGSFRLFLSGPIFYKWSYLSSLSSHIYTHTHTHTHTLLFLPPSLSLCLSHSMYVLTLVPVPVLQMESKDGLTLVTWAVLTKRDISSYQVSLHTSYCAYTDARIILLIWCTNLLHNVHVHCTAVNHLVWVTLSEWGCLNSLFFTDGIHAHMHTHTHAYTHTHTHACIYIYTHTHTHTHIHIHTCSLP